MIHPITQKIITVFHILFMAFLFGIPFTDSNYFLLVHAIIIPFIMIHWVCNDKTCVLCIMEQKFRSKVLDDDDPQNCVTCKVIHPIYEFKRKYQKHSTVIYAMTILLWVCSMAHLGLKYRDGEIDGFLSLFRV